MMLRYSSLAVKPEVFRSLTGLSIQEFEALLPSFNEAWEDFLKVFFVDGVARKCAFGGGRRPRLKSGRAKLLFILFYLRIYPIQEVQGFFFGLSQEQANCWIHRLVPVLSQALGREALLPERRPARLEEVLRQYPAMQEEVASQDSSGQDSPGKEGPGELFEEASGLVLFIDGTERRIRRPSDPGRQKSFYSGKKKAHTIKNVLLTDPNRRVLYLSRTCEGKEPTNESPTRRTTAFPTARPCIRTRDFRDITRRELLPSNRRKSPKVGSLPRRKPPKIPRSMPCESRPNTRSGG
ncbi:transposase family protein [Salinibacter ruber]|uniref:transposase family protein n=1 Tax=Salinibacter ruber TaxID=146919 RepID=UPI0005B95094|nr:transposase family protein [Salinibacter ruber]